MCDDRSAPGMRELDVRSILAAGGSPLESILRAVRELEPGMELRLLVPFEPKPLYAKLGDMGFGHRVRVRVDGVWEVDFALCEGGGALPVLLDLRALEESAAANRVGVAAGRLAGEASVVVWTRGRLEPLVGSLEERGFVVDTMELGEGAFETVIRRRPSGEGGV